MAPRPEPLEEAGVVLDVEDRGGRAAVAVGVGVAGRELLEEAGEIGDVEDGCGGAAVAVGVAGGGAGEAEGLAGPGVEGAGGELGAPEGARLAAGLDHEGVGGGWLTD